jgi:uncharacterized protein (DUF302 family)
MNFEINLNSDIESGISKITEALKSIGFGILTRIDFDQKIKEKLGIDLPKIAILGACNPTLAYEAYKRDSNMLLLIPCNVVLEENGNTLNVKLIKPSFMMKVLNSPELQALAKTADDSLENAIQSLKGF